MDKTDQTVQELNGVESITMMECKSEIQTIREGKENTKVKSEKTLLYKVTDVPPWYTCLFLGFQHYMAIYFGGLASSFVLSDALCMRDDPVVKSELLGAQFFVSGLVTLFQVLTGVRLPIIQSTSLSLLVPTLSYLSLPKNECPLIQVNCSDIVDPNITCIEKGSLEYHHIWQSRLGTFQGSMMIASLAEVLLGLSGGIGFLLNYIGPVSICPTISLIGLGLFKKSSYYGSQNWPVCIMTLTFLIGFAQYLSVINIPIPVYKRKSGGLVKRKYPLFKMFPVLLALAISWLICYILTITNAIPNNPSHWAYGGRTDTRSGVISNAPWFSIFWPGKYGQLNVDFSLVLGLLSGFLSSMIESVGDYHACARMSCVSPPPKHAINRGIMVEGIGCMVAGAFGTGTGTTSMSTNSGIICLTRVASRSVMLYTGMIMIVLAMFSKLGTLFVTLPEPIVGAVFMVVFGMVVAIGLSNLQYVDLNSPRNLFVLGFSFFMGVAISEYMKSGATLNTGVEALDSIISVCLSTSMFVGGVLAFILDNTIPGTNEERGIFKQKKKTHIDDDDTELSSISDRVYELPFYRKYLKGITFLTYLPICPGKKN